ncbi:cadmium-translocating P-type ATPase [Alginatibacterium sediminis]|uniref:Cadmium-translocating P-type ATPase n=1 Tax=Alginatibacterium sediminis TaxID=2164068 RepID=A0A420EH36_9ALTE|nr:heavy metal translocating P-type ATPase [Alginatibacterium sediminis]RKF20025.1 cadmium-translocating P-type ATPase [Alginatibacterium sediminis]
MASNSSISCYHCGEDVPKNLNLEVQILGQKRPMCCQGCFAVANTIIESGLSDYYKHRTAIGPSGAQLVPEELEKLTQYDNLDIQAEFVADSGEYKEVLLCVEGIACAACAWLIEKQIGNQDGVLRLNVNSTTQRANLHWDPTKLELSQILQDFQNLGYQALPFQTDQQEAFYKKTYRQHLTRLGVAGLATMQVMMFAFALYGDFFGEMDAQFIGYFRWVSLLMATPVLLYSAQPFYVSAYRALRSGSLNMDLPVSIALLGAYSASLYATVQGHGEVYFESVSMFTFLLLLGRLLELRARRKASESSTNLLKLIPKVANRLDTSGNIEVIACKLLKVGDIVRVRLGETVSADGIIKEGHCSIDESMLNGESLPLPKTVGDQVFAGSINHGQSIDIQVVAAQQQTFIAQILRLQEQAHNDKASVASLADTVSRYFVAGLLVIASLCYGYWSIYSPDDAFWITLAVLVATCPCALSLATPAALTIATQRLSKHGVLVKTPHVLESLAALNTIVSDKTGTLTLGQLELCCDHSLSSQDLKHLSIACSMEARSLHPIALAFTKASKQYQLSAIKFDSISEHSGQGLQAYLDNDEYRLGSAHFCHVRPSPRDTMIEIVLCCNGTLLGRYYFKDQLKQDAIEFSQYLKQRNIELQMLSGDTSSQVFSYAKLLDISVVKAGAMPKQKLEYVNELQLKNHKLMMLGDGVNDGPVLSAANLSMAMSHGTDLAKTSADSILLGDRLMPIAKAIETSIFCKKIIRQNMTWAIGYNVLILPLAATGNITPYIAALGMSLSSLIVLSNSLRLNKH